MLTTVLNIGVDFAIIVSYTQTRTYTPIHTRGTLPTANGLAQFFTEIALPGLFAAIDLLFCVIDFTPSGWNAQLECVEEKCFKGPNIVSDLLVFTHMPILLHRFTAIMEATLNSRTGKRFFGDPGPGTFTAEGRTIDPETGAPIERTETESARMGNPIYEFDFADSFKDFLPTTGADQCGGCFTCKWPEVRLIWLLTASIGSLFSEQNINSYRGNVTAHCLANGSWYARACGPAGAEQLTYRQWRARGYTAGFVELDARIFDSYAATIIERAREISGGSDAHFAQLVQAAHNWESVRGNELVTFLERGGDGDEAKAAAFVYHVCRNYRYEAEARGLGYDAPNDYHLLAGGSIERITGQFLWDTCRRFKFEIFSDFGRWAHQAVYDIQACTEDKVECKKESIRCLGSCSGVDGSEYKHDFATTVALTELSELVLGDGFDGAAANCTLKTYVFKVPTFAGGESFRTWAARLQTRSGMTAIDTAWCEKSAASCAVIQRVLERSPQLVFVNGEFRHVYSSVGPSPPPPPLPPPRLFRYADQPPSPSPPPGSPPPFYKARTRALRLHIGPPRHPYPIPSLPRTGRRAVHPVATARRLWPRPGRRRRRGRAHGGACELPLRAAHRRGAPARLRLLFARRHALSAAAAAANRHRHLGRGEPAPAARAPRRPRDLRGPAPHRRGAVRL